MEDTSGISDVFNRRSPYSTKVRLAGEPQILPPSGSVHHRFEVQAGIAPDAPAVEFLGQCVAYGEINRRANQLARHLRRAGVGPDCPVAVLLPRSPDLVVALLAVLKAGGAYVPLDASCPPDRVRTILQDAAAPVLITAKAMASDSDALGGSTVRLWMDALPSEGGDEAQAPLERPACPEHLAYIIYTSGSTGRPKGVAIEHRQLSVYLDWAAPLFSATGCGAPVQSSVSFDLAVTSLWLPLVTGRTVFLVPEEDALGAFADLLRRNRHFSLLKVTPSHLEALDRMLGDSDVSKAAQCLVVGGEAFSPQLAARWRRRMPAARIYNEYGPTEATVACTVVEVSEADLAGETLPIGCEVPGTWIDVMGADGFPVSDGGVGELWIGGSQVARGYWRDPVQTAERFVPGPEGTRATGRFYRTGDRGLRRPDGRLMYLGRLDRQVKIRGYRVEPEEIEAALMSCPGVRAAAVEAMPASDGTPELIAYLVASAGIKLSAREIRSELGRHLADYMVPGRFLGVEELPLTANGKLDRCALHGSKSIPLSVDREFVAPQTPMELRISKFWEVSLSRGDVGITDNFFALGGNSLTALALIASIQRQLGFALPFAEFLKDPTIKGMAAHHDGNRGADEPGVTPIPSAGGVGWAPATGEQVNLWITQQIAPDPGAYNVAYAARLRGPVDPELLEQALRTVISRQDVLRTQFRLLDDDLVQDIVSLSGPLIEWEDFRAVLPERRESVVAAALKDAARTRIDTEVAPLWRFRVLRETDEQQVLVFTLNHALVDEWSMHLLFGELELAYRMASGEAVSLPELPIRFADFAIWQQKEMNRADLKAHEAYWRHALGNYPGGLRLPADQATPANPTGRGGRLFGSIPPFLRGELRRLAQEEGTSEFVLMLGAWQAWLSLQTGDREVLVATPVARRERPEVQHLAGLFLQTLPIPATVDSQSDFRSFLRGVRQRVTQSIAHAALPLAQILKAMPRVSGGRSVFPAAFALLDRSWPLLRLPGTTSEPVRLEAGSAKFDLLLLMTPDSDGGWRVELEYSADLFSPGRVGELLVDLQRFLAAIAGRPDAPGFGRLPINGSPDPTIPGRFRQEVRRCPEAAALVFEGRRWTYAELDHRTDVLAAELQGAGVSPRSRVGLHLDRSAEWIIAALAVLKAGAAYVPLQPGWPELRLRELAEEAGVCCVVLSGSAAPNWVPGGVAVLDVNTPPVGSPPRPLKPVFELTSESPAYVLFTSGSTGKPKGVLVPHRAVHRLVVGQDYAPFGPELRCLHLSSPAFDASTFEIWGPLLNGGTCVVLSPGHLDAPSIGRAVKEQHVNCLFLTTGLFNQLMDLHPEALDGVTHLLTGGEVLSESHAARALEALPGTRLIHCYGPTETTTFATTGEVPPVRDWTASHPVPIGREIAGAWAHVMDRDGNPVKPGEPGELYIGGDGVALGYVNDPESTAQRFVPDPADPTGRARRYRTGDRVRRLPDGRLVFLGRMDAQLKIRGHRIEPAEIENVLSEHPMVRQAFVVARPAVGGVLELVACIQRQPGVEWDVDALRRHLGSRLPDYMMPGSFRELDSVPLSASGKVDRDDLARVVNSMSAPAMTSVAPRTPVEAILCREWAAVLARPGIGIHDNFFDHGGQSLVALRLVGRMKEVLHHPVRIADLFAHPTIARLAEVFGSKVPSGTSDPAPFRGQRAGAPWFHLPGVYGLEFLTPVLRDAIGAQRPYFDGLQYPGLDGFSEPLSTVEAIAEALVLQLDRIHPAGPVWLSGFSFGGAVAYEMARRLTARGRTVEGVVLFDTCVAGSLRRRPFMECLRVLAERTWSRPRGGRIGYVGGILSKKIGDGFQILKRFSGLFRQGPSELVEAASLRAHASYRPEPYGGHVFLLRATQVMPHDTGLWIRDEFNGWKTVMGPHFRLINLECDHARVFLDPVAPQAVEAVQTVLASGV